MNKNTLTFRSNKASPLTVAEADTNVDRLADAITAAESVATVAGIGDATASGKSMLSAASAQAQANLLPNFGASNRGIVPNSGGATYNYLRADGSWTSVIASVSMGTNTEINVVIPRHYRNITGNTTLTFSASLVIDQEIQLTLTNTTGTDYTVTIPSSYSHSLDEVITSFVIPGGATREMLWSQGDAQLTLYGEQYTPLPSADDAPEVVSSASTVDLGATASRNVQINGSTAITSFGTTTSGVHRRIVMGGALDLTYNATSLILPSSATIRTAAGDVFEAISLGSGNWKVFNYERLDSQPITQRRVATVSALRGLRPPNTNTTVEVEGYYSSGDGGGGRFVWDSASTASDNDGTIFLPNTSPASGRWKRVYDSFLSAAMFGAGNGGPSDRARIVSAIAALSSGGTLYFPATTYTIDHSVATLFTLTSGIKFQGAGVGTILNIDDNAVAGSKVCFQLNGDDCAITDMAINFAVDNGVAFAMAGNRAKFERLTLNGGHTAVAATTFHGWLLDSASDKADLYLTDNVVRNFRYGILRSNATTSAFRRIRLRGNHFYDNYANHIAFNSPNGIMDDITVIGNTFGDCPGGDAFSTFAIQLGMASVTNYRIVGNHFSGICKDAIHLEEAGSNIVVSGNTFTNITKGANTNGGRAIYIVDNNVAGVGVGPTRLVVTNNVMRGNSTANADVGINFIRSATFPATNYVCQGNVIDTFGFGISTVQDELAIISDNIIQNCTTGIRMPDTASTMRSGTHIKNNIVSDCTTGMDCNRGWPSIAGNSFKDCTTGIEANGPGQFGYTSFYNCTTPCNSTGESPSFSGIFIEKTGQTIAATPTATNADLIEFPDSCGGHMTFNIGSATNASLWVARFYEIDITSGGTVTVTDGAGAANPRTQRTAGNVATTGLPANNAGQLSVPLSNSGAAITDAVYQMTFNGFWAFNP